jgi:polyhydroxyalkanoate synthesis repressor PhaR
MPVIIKRYRNRKLYNTQTKKYVTLEGIEELIKQQEDIKVIDNDNENDITATTLSQIIFGSEKNQTGVLPTSLLISLVQSGGKKIDVLRRNIFNSLNLSHHFDVEIEKRVNLLIANGEFSQDAGIQILQKLLSVGYKHEDIRENVDGGFIEFLKEWQIPTKNDFQNVINRIEVLSKKVEGYKSENIDKEISVVEGQIIE